MDTFDNFGNDNTMFNISEYDPGDAMKDRLVARFNVQFAVTAAMSLLTVLTNIIILVAFYVEKKLQTYTNWYILNTTIADLVVGLVLMPLRSTIFLYGKWAFGGTAGILFLGFQNSILGVSVFGVIVICIDRYIATFYPIQHFQRKSIRKATIANICTWVLSFGVWMGVTCLWDFLAPIYTTSSSGLRRANYTLTTTSVLLVSVGRATGPFVFMTAFYFRIIFHIRKIQKRPLMSLVSEHNPSRHSDSVHECGSYYSEGTDDVKNNTQSIPSISLNVSNNGGDAQETRNSTKHEFDVKETDSPLGDKSDKPHTIPSTRTLPKQFPGRRIKGFSAESQKAMRTLGFIIFAFFITWFPNNINLMIFAISPDLYVTINNSVKISTTELFRWISFSNSMINPFAYAMAQPLIRKTVFDVLCFRRCI